MKLLYIADVNNRSKVITHEIVIFADVNNRSKVITHEIVILQMLITGLT